MRPTTEAPRPPRVMLMKDNKPICRTRCSNDLSLEIPSTWTIVKFKPRSVFQWNILAQFQLFPDPQNCHQMREWAQFLSYLQQSGMVAVVYADYFSFYILALNGDQEYTYCIVHLWIRNPALASDYERNGGWVHGHPRSSFYSRNSYRESYRSERTLQNKQQFTCPSPSSISSLEDMVTDPENFGNNIRDGSSENLCKSVKDVDIVDGEWVSIIHRNQCKDVKMCKRTARQSMSNKVIQIGSTTSDQADVMISDFRQKNLVRMDPSYLTTLGQTHSAWIFGAIAELIDNSRDAHATRLEISVELLYSKKDGNKIPVLSLVDDGDGMTHNDILRMLSFGHKQKNREDQDRIGKFGIGFKTGAMKLGKDALVLTQSSTSRSIAFLSQSYNENKDNIEIPIVSYIKNGRYMEIDASIQSEELANFNLSAIKEFSPFNEYLLGEQLGLYGKDGTGTQIFIWNLDKWCSDYTLVWNDENDGCQKGLGDIIIRSKRIRSRLGQISCEVPLDYSLQAYLEVLFLNPRMKIFIQGSLVKSHPLEKSLSRTVAVKGSIMARPIQLVLGRSQVEWERMNGGVFLYWKGRLIEAYKRVGGMQHNADLGRGVIGVADVTSIMHNGNGHVWVLNNKQGFQDCEAYAKLEDWLGSKFDEYWDENYDNLDLETNVERFKPDHEWVQCDKCRKWRMLSAGFNIKSLPLQWFCYMPPFNGKCEAVEQQMEAGVVTISAKRHQHVPENSITKSGQSSPSPEAIVKEKSRIDLHKLNLEAKCEEDWGHRKSRSVRMPKRTSSNHDLKPNHQRNFKRERNFNSWRPRRSEQNGDNAKVELN
ncbi:MORC family CW-type zinc finger protein 2-like isoform X2 [Phalaenopsis equestris]|uniref:MORC family CW-type zinc finger protein 2-like isoform X2 n=1 Tax=Phalaenopsis equestris TaxID=78828 RepID=UPI0009E2BB4B|nr:MORC family CW-type zinc finger protein 2-like isoform X2 [Phalaenopsis equestris]XP_020590248.1 MORC family CW-type zinc finger protein 2-like isoform X2 [Phalaenopsis equestris]